MAEFSCSSIQPRRHATLQPAWDAKQRGVKQARFLPGTELEDGVGRELSIQDRGGVEANAAGHLYLRGWAPAPEGCPTGRRCPQCWSARLPPPTDAPENTPGFLIDNFKVQLNKCPINVYYNFIFDFFLRIFQFGTGNINLFVYTEEHWHPVIQVNDKCGGKKETEK